MTSSRGGLRTGECRPPGSGVTARRRTAGSRYRAGSVQPTDARSSPHPSALFRPCLRPSERVPARSVPLKTASSAAGSGFVGTERAGKRSDGRKRGRNSADGCGEDRAGLADRLTDWRRIIHGCTACLRAGEQCLSDWTAPADPPIEWPVWIQGHTEDGSLSSGEGRGKGERVPHDRRRWYH